MIWNWKWKKMLVSISSKYSYLKPIFNYSRKGLWKGTLIFQNCDTLVWFHPIVLVHGHCQHTCSCVVLHHGQVQQYFQCCPKKFHCHLCFFIQIGDTNISSINIQILMFNYPNWIIYRFLELINMDYWRSLWIRRFSWNQFRAKKFNVKKFIIQCLV